LYKAHFYSSCPATIPKDWSNETQHNLPPECIDRSILPLKSIKSRLGLEVAG